MGSRTVPTQGKKCGVGSEKTQRFSILEPSCLCLFRGGLWGVSGTKMGFAGGWAGGRQVGRAALSEVMLPDK